MKYDGKTFSIKYEKFQVIIFMGENISGKMAKRQPTKQLLKPHQNFYPVYLIIALYVNAKCKKLTKSIQKNIFHKMKTKL